MTHEIDLSELADFDTISYVGAKLLFAARKAGYNETQLKQLASTYGEIESDYEAMFHAARHLEPDVFNELFESLYMYEFIPELTRDEGKVAQKILCAAHHALTPTRR